MIEQPYMYPSQGPEKTRTHGLMSRVSETVVHGPPSDPQPFHLNRARRPNTEQTLHHASHDNDIKR
jgi:hypothetical protein